MEYTTFILILCDIVSYDPFSSDVHVIVPRLIFQVKHDRVTSALFSPLYRLVRTK